MKKNVHLLWPISTGILAAFLLILILNPNLQRFTQGTESYSTNAHNKNVPGSYQELKNISFSEAVEKSAPAVVNIYTRKTVIRHSHPIFSDPLARKLFGLTESPKEKVLTGLGSGVIMNTNGYILTNQHVIAGADEILVELRDKRQSRVEVIGSDLETDLAVLKINLDHLPSIEVHRDPVSVGDIALAIGNPLGIGQTVTMGIVSATGRTNLGLTTYENFIQTDAAINRGNSGGALINSIGKIIGINSVIFSKSGGSDGIGLAIPITLAEDVMQSIIKQGKVIRGWLGASFQQLSPELANYLATQKNNGVVITRLLKDGPAHKAGIMVGDLIFKIDGKTIITEQDALKAIARIVPGEKTKLEIIRKNQPLSLEVEVGERPSR